MLSPRSDRRHSAPSEKPDQRTEFQRDRDRVLYSWAFRRLAGVTQVVHAQEGHVFHNRLTHSIKVAQVARRIAQHLIDREQLKIENIGEHIDPDVVETAALVHDLGHPPFGHIAEEELDTQLREKNFYDGYEGNAQSFRIVTKVILRNFDCYGLNLTRATLNACMKYPWNRGDSGPKFRKWGYFETEREDFLFARELGPALLHKSAEAAIMDWADDITYSVHDVEDFYRAGLIPLHELLSGPDDNSAGARIRQTELDRFLDNVYTKWEQENDDTIKIFGREKAVRFFAFLSTFAAELDTQFEGTRRQEIILNILSSFLIRRYVMQSEPGANSVNVTMEKEELVIQPDAELVAEVKLLKALMRYYVYDRPALLAQQFGHRRVVRELFEIFFEAVKPGSGNRNLLPARFRQYCEQIDTSEDSTSRDLERSRLAADVIASMTEQQALLIHQRLIGITPGSLLNPIVI